MTQSRLVLLVQLPIPPAGPGPVEGNVPLAAAYLKLYARRQGLEKSYQIELLPSAPCDTLGDQGLVEELLGRRPWMVGFTCYVWNVERTLWVAHRLKERRPELKVLLGGPEITADNAWALEQPAVDFAALGEGERTFAELLAMLAEGREASTLIAGLWQRAQPAPPPPRAPLDDLDAVSSPYVEGIIDVDDGQRMLLETVRGCRFRCKYCYYPKSFDTQRFLSAPQVTANLDYAVDRGAKEVVLLDPTLNQRPDFADFLRLLARGNPQRQLSYSGELRAEGIDGEMAGLLRQANFHEVEIGLQSVEPRAWELMGRPTNLAAFERGVKALLAEGIKARVDLILGLPGDTADSVRRGIDFLIRTQAYSEVQVFNLSILPGTAFRREAAQLGLTYQPWPPYYVLKTPTLDIEQIYQLMDEAEEAFGIEFDPLPPPRLDLFDDPSQLRHGSRIDLDVTEAERGSNDGQRRTAAGKSDVPLQPTSSTIDSAPAACFTLWLRSADFRRQQQKAAGLIDRLLADNPHTSLLVILEPTGRPEHLTAETLEPLLAACYRTTNYLDRYYSLHPGQLLGSKRLFILLPLEMRAKLMGSWRREVTELATLLWRGDLPPTATLERSALIVPPTA